MTVEDQISELVDQVCDLIEERVEWNLWSPETRERYRVMLLQRIDSELKAREE